MDIKTNNIIEIKGDDHEILYSKKKKEDGINDINLFFRILFCEFRVYLK